jgi:stage V sporulation protein AC
MNKSLYQKIVKNHTPQEDRLKNAIRSFIIGGIIGIIGQFLISFYSFYLNLSANDSATIMIITIIFIAALLTAIGIFDNFVSFAKAGAFVPITGFAHSMMSSSLEYKKEGLIMGIGSNMLKLAGTVIVYGIVSAYVFGLIRFILLGG